ncbi:MAG: GNAT family N-acetyltransferase [Acidobacteriota bacterium]
MLRNLPKLNLNFSDMVSGDNAIFIVPEIETERLRLRRFASNDYDALYRIFSNPEVIKFFGEGDPPSKEETEALLNRYIDAYWQEHHLGKWAVIDKPSKTLIGFCGFTMIRKIPEIAYMFAQEYWGRGLATEAAAACLGYGFEVVGIESAIAYTRPENQASKRVLEKIGMIYENIEAHYGYVFDKYGINRQDYRKFNHQLTSSS